MGFFAVQIDNGVPVPKPELTPALVISREIPRGDEQRRLKPMFLITEPFGYHYEASDESIVVPADVSRSSTDLASIPVWLGWLAAKTGRNLPAALLHDVLIIDRPAEINHWISTDGTAFVEADEQYPPDKADAMFRDAMGDVGVDAPRRWIMWAGVSLATMWKSLPGGWRRIQAWVRVALLAVIALVAGLILLPDMVLDLLDIEAAWELPGMGDRAWIAEVGGAALILLALTAVATLLVGLGVTRTDYWIVGLMIVPTVFVLGWLIVFSYLQNLVFSTRLLLDRQSRVMANPVSTAAPVGEMATFEANVALRKGDRLRWVEELPGGEQTVLEGTDQALQVLVTPERHGATYRVQVVTENTGVVTQSSAAKLELKAPSAGA